jgi:hypothetical protein
MDVKSSYEEDENEKISVLAVEERGKIEEIEDNHMFMS